MYKITIVGAETVNKKRIIQHKWYEDKQKTLTICESNNQFDMADSDVVIFVFKLSDRSTFYSLEQFHRTFNSCRKQSCLSFLVGIQNDETPEVFVNNATNFAIVKQMSYTSVSTSEEINQLFERIIINLEKLPKTKGSCAPLSDRCIHQ
tara:strand:- start:65 stop:511 length:447 start_codon:yes stop_codon:yes gene_type:complete